MALPKKKKKSPFTFKKLIIIPLFLANCIAALGLLLSFLAQFIPPTWGSYIAFCGLGFIYILAINALFVVLWLPIKYPFALISLSLILLNVGNMDKHFQLKETEKPPSCTNCIKVMSYNVKLFGLYDTENKKMRKQNKNKILQYINEEQPDIVCFQEYFYDQSGKLDFNTTDTLLSILKLKSKNSHFEYFTATRGDFYYGFATFSKNKIVGNGIVEMPDSTVIATYIDFKNRNDTIRVYNCHLASIHFENEDYEIGKQLIINPMNDPKWQKKVNILYKKMELAYKIRRHQTKVLKQHLKKCSYYIILCGDLNDSPASFAYNKVAGNLKDSFRESGKGMDRTYLGETFPKFRIDYILHDRAYKSYGHTVGTDISISDHYPIYTWISLYRN
ncbi:MAG: endonuclease/exonuclease/phosphatase family protein [Bacteroidetes bacterium]|nr:endonuclease/exonuclease/phosphatase family protein [Bacteroidota bacterium]MCL1969590.1 endonuclease/exonuclease/phosphatase family protein [Bacteroidota bacterium]